MRRAALWFLVGAAVGTLTTTQAAERHAEREAAGALAACRAEVRDLRGAHAEAFEWRDHAVACYSLERARRRP